MYASLNDAEKVNVYKQYVDVYGLGLHIETDDELSFGLVRTVRSVALHVPSGGETRSWCS
jgi:hypothetical protein